MKAIIRWFQRLHFVLTVKAKWRPVPRRLISPYEMSRATESERILMTAGVARSPHDARLLLIKYNTENPHEVLEKIPKRRGVNVMKRIKRLIRTFEGHDRNNPYKGQTNKNKIQVRYRYKNEKSNTRN